MTKMATPQHMNPFSFGRGLPGLDTCNYAFKLSPTKKHKKE